jgi:hypothetical protein
MKSLQEQIHILAKADSRYPEMKKKLQENNSKYVVSDNEIWLQWLEIYFDAMLKLYNDCKKEDLKESCYVLKDLFKIQALEDRTFVKNSRLMEKYKLLRT